MVAFGAGDAGVIIYRYLTCATYENGNMVEMPLQEVYSPVRDRKTIGIPLGRGPLPPEHSGVMFQAPWQVRFLPLWLCSVILALGYNKSFR